MLVYDLSKSEIIVEKKFIDDLGKYRFTEDESLIIVKESG